MSVYDRTVAEVREQRGSEDVSFTAGVGTLTFPTAFATSPNVMVTMSYNASGVVDLHVLTVSASSASLRFNFNGTGHTGTRTVVWQAWVD